LGGGGFPAGMELGRGRGHVVGGGVRRGWSWQGGGAIWLGRVSDGDGVGKGAGPSGWSGCPAAYCWPGCPAKACFRWRGLLPVGCDEVVWHSIGGGMGCAAWPARVSNSSCALAWAGCPAGPYACRSGRDGVGCMASLYELFTPRISPRFPAHLTPHNPPNLGRSRTLTT